MWIKLNHSKNLEAAEESARNHRYSSVLNKPFVFRFLTSQKGKKLNGQRCTVVGADDDLFDGRYHCKLDSGRVVKAKHCNLAQVESSILHQLDGYKEEDLISPSDLLPYLEDIISWGEGIKFHKEARADAIHRIKVLNEYRLAMLEAYPNLRKKTVARKEKDSEKLHTSDDIGRIDSSRIPCGDDRYYSKDKPGLTYAETAHYNAMRATKFACCGDGIVDFRRFSFGLCGASFLPECAICLDDITQDVTDVIKMDCFHVFHNGCISDWIESRGNKNCPTCNQELRRESIAEQRLDFGERIRIRLREFILSGYCEKCHSMFYERKRRDGEMFIRNYLKLPSFSQA